jgi:predicted NBD/HSP70 family sugar kinase
VVEHIAARLGSAIATVCAILDPELVVLGGGIGSSPMLLRPVRGAAAALVPLTARIETSLLGAEAALRGAIAFALHAARSQLIPQGGGGTRRAASAHGELIR